MHSGGITHLKFSLRDFYLFSGARRDNNILVWDIRNTIQPLRYFTRDSNTNQRMIFDVDEFGTKLIAGNRNGSIMLFDVNKGHCIKLFGGHFDCIGSIQFSPLSSEIALSGSGQRHYKVVGKHVEEEFECISDNDTTNEQMNSLRIWHIPY